MNFQNLRCSEPSRNKWNGIAAACERRSIKMAICFNVCRTNNQMHENKNGIIRAVLVVLSPFVLSTAIHHYYIYIPEREREQRDGPNKLLLHKFEQHCRK